MEGKLHSFRVEKIAKTTLVSSEDDYENYPRPECKNRKISKYLLLLIYYMYRQKSRICFFFPLHQPMDLETVASSVFSPSSWKKSLAFTSSKIFNFLNSCLTSSSPLVSGGEDMYLIFLGVESGVAIGASKNSPL
jgi:hypothetical protein